MCAIRVRGLYGREVRGCVEIQGCKNAALPILAATLLNGKTNIIHNCPNLSDVAASVDILNSLGCRAEFGENTAFVDSSGLCSCRIDTELMGAMRSSVLFVGALLSRLGRAEFTMPGGCDIGLRPIDIHLASFERMGVDVECSEGNVICRADNLRGGDIHLPLPSVGATENIILLAAKGKGITRIYNAAREPEICDLADYINSMGGRIHGAGSSLITIYPVDRLGVGEHRVMPDRIETLTFAGICAACGGEIVMNRTTADDIAVPMNTLCRMGLVASPCANRLIVTARRPMVCLPRVSTAPYPGFPTDAQSLLMTVMSTALGEGIIEENIFEKRLGHASELAKMGADISIDGSCAYVRGGRLHGAEVIAGDLRSGAALAAAGLAAEGDTLIHGSEYIDRGYDGFVRKLGEIGATAERI